jgi:hypothetical protein
MQNEWTGIGTERSGRSKKKNFSALYFSALTPRRAEVAWPIASIAQPPPALFSTYSRWSPISLLRCAANSVRRVSSEGDQRDWLS